jgi:hypothetical protein
MDGGSERVAPRPRRAAGEPDYRALTLPTIVVGPGRPARCERSRCERSRSDSRRRDSEARSVLRGSCVVGGPARRNGVTPRAAPGAHASPRAAADRGGMPEARRPSRRAVARRRWAARAANSRRPTCATRRRSSAARGLACAPGAARRSWGIPYEPLNHRSLRCAPANDRLSRPAGCERSRCERSRCERSRCERS